MRRLLWYALYPTHDAFSVMWHRTGYSTSIDAHLAHVHVSGELMCRRERRFAASGDPPFGLGPPRFVAGEYTRLGLIEAVRMSIGCTQDSARGDPAAAPDVVEDHGTRHIAFEAIEESVVSSRPGQPRVVLHMHCNGKGRGQAHKSHIPTSAAH